MKKSLLRAAITTALTVAFAVPAFANPFSDVPSTHWAYEAVNNLQKAGIVDGYNGKFNGTQNMTRYEMAQVIAKAMTKAQTAEQKGTVDKLSKEFAVELMNLGVKVDSLDKKIDNMVKVSGDARVRYFNTEDANDVTDYRARVSLDGKINNNMKFNARLTSGNASSEGVANTIKLDTANASFKTYAMDTTVGRQDIKLGSGFIMDSQMNGISSKIGNLKAFGGKVTQTADGTKAEKFYGAEYGANILGAKVTADYLKDVTNKQEIFGANASAEVIKGVTATGEFFKNNDLDATATAYGVKLNKLGLSAMYRDVEAGAMSAYSTMNANGSFTDQAGGFKGMVVPTRQRTG